MYIYLLDRTCGLTCIPSLISEEVFLLIKLHGIQKKLSVNDIKTKRYGNLNFLLEVFKLSLQISNFRRILTWAEFQCVHVQNNILTKE